MLKHAFACLHIHKNVYTYTYLKIYTYTNIKIYIPIYTYIHKNVYTHTYIYSYIHILIYTYTHIYLYSYIHTLIKVISIVFRIVMYTMKCAVWMKKRILYPLLTKQLALMYLPINLYVIITWINYVDGCVFWV